MTPICAFDIAPDGTAVALDDITAPQGDGYRWLHLDLNDAAARDWVTAHLPPLAGRAVLAEETRPRALVEDHALLATLRGVNLNAGDAPEDMVSIRIWATATLVVTLRRRRIFAVDDMRQLAVAGSGPATPGAFVAALASGLTARIEATSLALDDQADVMEDAVYDRGETALPALAPLRRQVIKLRRHLGPQTIALHELARVESPLFDRTLRAQLREAANRATRSDEELSEVRERLTALSDHLDTHHSMRMGRNSYILSVIAGIFLPLGVLTGLFGVNLAGIPMADAPWAFAALCLAMVAICLLGWLVLRWKRWL